MFATPGCDVNVSPAGDDDVAAGAAWATPVANAPTSPPIDAIAKTRFRITTTISSCNRTPTASVDTTCVSSKSPCDPKPHRSRDSSRTSALTLTRLNETGRKTGQQGSRLG